MFDLYRLRKVPGYWYIATPYSKYPGGIDEAFKEAARVSAYLVKNAVRIFCPIAHTHPIAIHGNIDPYSHELWMPIDKPFMKGACGVVVAMMDTWDESYGVRVEIDYFDSVKKPVHYLEPAQWKNQS